MSGEMSEKPVELSKLYNRLNGLYFIAEVPSCYVDFSLVGFVGSYLGSGFYLVGLCSDLENTPLKYEPRVRHASKMEAWSFFENESSMLEALRIKNGAQGE